MTYSSKLKVKAGLFTR